MAQSVRLMADTASQACSAQAPTIYSRYCSPFAPRALDLRLENKEVAMATWLQVYCPQCNGHLPVRVSGM